MSFIGDLGKFASSAWDGNEGMWGDAAAATAGMLGAGLGAIPGVGSALKMLVPDAKEARDWTNEALGANPNDKSEGNMGNHIGSVLGGLAGTIFGPMGMVGGAALGSAAGGWISDLFGGDEKTATKSPTAAPVNPMLGPALVGGGWQQGQQSKVGGVVPSGPGGLNPGGFFGPPMLGSGSNGAGTGWAQAPRGASASGSTGSPFGPFGPYNPTPGLPRY